MGTKVIITDAILAYSPGLFTPNKPMNGQGDPKYGSPFIISKNNPAVAAIKKAMQDEAVALWKDKAASVFAAAKAANKIPLRDGDGKLDKNGDQRPEYVGKLFVSTNSKKAPMLLDQDKSIIRSENTNRLYSGCKVVLAVEIKAYDIPNVPGGRGVRAELLAVQRAGDGERIGGGATVSPDDFVAIPDSGDAGAGATPAAGAGAANPFD